MLSVIRNTMIDPYHSTFPAHLLRCCWAEAMYRSMLLVQLQDLCHWSRIGGHLKYLEMKKQPEPQNRNFKYFKVSNYLLLN